MSIYSKGLGCYIPALRKILAMEDSELLNPVQQDINLWQRFSHHRSIKIDADNSIKGFSNSGSVVASAPPRKDLPSDCQHSLLPLSEESGSLAALVFKTIGGQDEPFL